MRTEKNVNSTSDTKVVRVKKRVHKAKKYVVKFDKEGFSLAWGLGIVCSGIGVLIIWATKTAPEGISHSTGYSISQRAVNLLPESSKATLGFIIGILFLLFGVICIFLGLKIVVKYLANKFR